jgi:CheY-like chemotaxis protein
MDHVVLSDARPVTAVRDPLVSPQPARAAKAKPLVVIVNAHPRCGQALQSVLGRHFRLKEYASGEQAWASLQLDSDVAAVVCSNSLPRMSGVELVAKLRKVRLPALRKLPVCLVADSIDDELRSRVSQQVDYLCAYDRPLVDLLAWLKERISTGVPADVQKASRSDALRRWTMQHAGLDPKKRESLVVFRVMSEGVGVLSQRLARTIRRPEMMLADSINCVWLCVDVPISSAVKFAIRLALGSVSGSDRDQVRITVSYAPLMRLADETYDVLQTMVDTEPPLRHLQVMTHHWRFVMPFEAARLLVK